MHQSIEVAPDDWSDFNQRRTGVPAGRSRLSIVHVWKMDRRERLSYLDPRKKARGPALQVVSIEPK
ncbi:MAG: hypothetical protein JWO48_1914 [Bryobacterales bacterium]|nr:hypothetical protein [Bryobacterales bacterium]